MYVSAPQANLRDHVSTIYNRVGAVKNGDRVVVLERQKRFVRVRTAQNVEGWIELRALVPDETYDQFQHLSKDNRTAPVQGHGITRVELNMHVSPGRETDTLYLLAENSKVELLKRSTTGRATPEEVAASRAAALAKAAGEMAKSTTKKHPAHAQKAAPPKVPPAATQPAKRSANQATTSSATPSTDQSDEPKPKPMDDWWLVRDQQGHTGWVLARMVDLDIPLEVVQYAEGQRIQAAFVLNTVHDEDKGTVAQYLVLLNENHDGIPYDFNQVRVFTWNLKRHRYETGYREHFIIGYFPATVSTQDFGKEGVLPVFTIRKQNADGSISERRYRVIGNVVRQVLAPGEAPEQAAQAPGAPPKKSVAASKAAKGAAKRTAKNAAKKSSPAPSAKQHKNVH
jgi:SH3-like domain-containing protein